jgi:hypothetical protein
MRVILAALLLGSFLFFMSVGSNAKNDHADIRGRITEIRPASAEEESRIIGTVFVESEEKDTKVDKANLIITDKTRILKEQDGKRVQTKFEEFKIGQLVEAEFVDGPTIMIYPLRVAAKEIVILSSGEPE